MHGNVPSNTRRLLAVVAVAALASAAAACGDDGGTSSTARPTTTAAAATSTSAAPVTTSPSTVGATSPPSTITATSRSATTSASSAPPTTAATPAAAAGPALQAGIDEVVRRGVPGVAVLRRADGVTEVGAAGVADLSTGTPVSADTAFRTGSIAKPFLAVVVLQLVDEGVVALDDSVERWLPGLVPGGERITVQHLLGNRSGLFDYIADPQVLAPYLAGDAGHVWTPEQLVAIAVAHPPNFAPGTAALYSNTDYTVAGMLVERATSRSVATEVQERVIGPLALRRTSMPDTGELVAPYAHGYAADAGMLDVTALHPSLSSFGGNLVSTLGDLSVFLDALFAGGLLPDDLLAEMASATTSVSGEQLGLGLQVLDLPCGRFIGHSGSTPGYKGAAFRAVDGDRQFVILANSLTQSDAVGSPEAGVAFEAAAVEAACGDSGA